MKKGHIYIYIYIYIFPDMKKTPEKNVQNMMKYWFGTINIYVWTIKNPFLITKTYENNENTSKFQF